MSEKSVVVSGRFDDLQTTGVRFLEEAARIGSVHALLWSDVAISQIDGQAPKFSEVERSYFLNALRYIDQVSIWRDSVDPDGLDLSDGLRPTTWVIDEATNTRAKRTFCQSHGLQCHILRPEELQCLPVPPNQLSFDSLAKRVLVTGSFDWFHTGHVRFFEEVSELGDLYVVVGHDANIKLLKGDGHPLFSEQQRRYLVQSIRYVKRALLSTGYGWLDAEPEIVDIKPHIYAVNEDGDRPEKRQYCESHGIEYRVLKRIPKEGLPRRQSTDLRGF